MEETNVAQGQPVQEPVVEQAPQTPEPQEAGEQEVSQEPAQEQSEAPAEEAPKQITAEVPEYDIRQYMQPQQQAPQFVPDEDGYIDPNQLYTKVLADAEARMEQKLAFQEAERKAWQSVETKYPEIKEDPELRDLVNSQRIADVAKGGRGDLNAVAGQVISKIQSYQARGKAQAQVSEKIQKSASLQKTTATNVDATKDNELLERMSRGDTGAADQLISEWLESGKL